MSDGLSPQAYEELIRQSVDKITVLDESGTVKYVNQSIERLLGYAPEEFVGENAFEYIHPDDRQQALDAFHEVTESPEGYTTGVGELRFRHTDGSWVWLETRGSNRTSTAIGGYVLTSRDITDRKRYEQQLRRERDRLQSFARFLTHDLRNPLTVAKGRLALAQEECESEHLDDVERSLDRMHELIEDGLTLVRESETEPLLDVVDLREVVTNCWQNVDTKAATLVVETDRHILADESLLKHLLENLVRNAVEHGGDGVTITVGDLADGFYVEDDGPGIPEADRDSLLEYGFSTKAGGTGLGLSIVHEVVKSHGWELTVTEGEDGGARFEITGVEIAD